MNRVSNALPPTISPTARVSAPRRMAVTATTSSGSEVATAMKMPPTMPLDRPVRSTITIPELAISQPARPTMAAQVPNPTNRRQPRCRPVVWSLPADSLTVPLVMRGSHIGFSWVSTSSLTVNR